MNKTGRFALVFDVTGNGPKTLSSMVDDLSGFGDEATKAQSAVEGLVESMAFKQVNDFGGSLMRAGAEGVGMFTSTLLNAVNTVAPLESVIQRVQSMTKGTAEATRGIVEDFLTLAEKTPFSSQQVISLGSALVQSKVSLDAFVDSSGKALTVLDAMNNGWAEGNKHLLKNDASLQSVKLSALSMLGDLAAMQGKSGEQMDYFIRAFQKALATGDLTSLRGDISPQMQQAIFGSMGGKTQVSSQQAMTNLFEYLKKEGQIGAMAAASTTMEAYVTGFQELPGMLYRNILGLPGSGGLYDKIRKGFADLYLIIVDTFGNEKFQASVKGAITPIVDLLINLGLAFATAIKGVLDFIEKYPAITKFITQFVFWGSVVTFLAGTFIAGSAALLGMVVTLKMLMAVVLPTLLPIAAAAGLIALKFLAVGAALYAVYRIVDSNFGGLKDAFTTVGLVFKGLWELVSTLSGITGEMSVETADALEKAGFLQFVIQLFGMVVRVKEMMMALWDSLAMGWASAKQVMGPAFAGLSDSISHLLTTVGEVAKLFGYMVQPNDLDQWTTLGNIVGAVLVTFIDIAAFFTTVFISTLAVVVKWVSTLVRALTELVDIFNKMPDKAMELSTAFGTWVEGKAADAWYGSNRLTRKERPQMSMETVGYSQNQQLSSQMSEVGAAVSSNASSQSTQSVETKIADVTLDGQKVGSVLYEVQQRNAYLNHSGG